MSGAGETPAGGWTDDDIRDLYENAPCGYLSIRGDGLIVRANRTILAWLGVEGDGFSGDRRFSELLTVGGRIFYETHFTPLLRMQGFVREIAFDLVRADGSRLPVLVNAARRASEGGRPEIIRITIFDATDRRRYERELLLSRNAAEQAARDRTSLIAMISHDVRSPLTAIMTSAAMLEKMDPTPQQQRFIRVLRSSATHAMTLVSSVLDLSRLDAGRSVLRERPFDVRELVGEIAAAGRIAAAQKAELSITVTVDPAVPGPLLGDRGKIGQVITNLVTNAIKFTDRGLISIIVSVREISDSAVTLEIAVSDTGIGIPADRLPHIFEEFTQASDEIADKYGGTGLGLTISRKLLLLYGSELTVTSTPGQGSMFTFALELKRAAPG